MNVEQAYCLGIDAHKENLTLNLLNREGEQVWRGKVAGNRAGLRKALSQILRKTQGDTSILAAVEASRSHYWVDEHLQACCQEGWLEACGVVQPDIAEGNRRQGKKSDWRDAQEISDLIRCDRAGWVYMPPEPYATLRLLSRDRMEKNGKITRCVNRIRGILARHGIQWPWRNLRGIRSRRDLQTVPVRPPEQQEILHLLEEIGVLERQAQLLGQQILQQLQGIPEASLLLAIPGMGPVLTGLILGEYGDLRRFRNAAEVAAFAGVVPRSNESGGTQRGQRITHRGSRLLRMALVSAGMLVSKNCPGFRDAFQRRSRRLKRHKARLANARSLAVGFYNMVSRNEPFRYLATEKR